MYYVFERGMDRGADGGRGGSGRDSTRNESGLEREREREEYDVTTRDSIPLSVYMQGGGGIEAPGEIFCVCGVCVGMCGCEKITRPGGRGCVTA